MKLMTKVISAGIVILGLLAGHNVIAEDRFAKVEIKVEQVAGDVYMLTGSGGNIGLLSTPDGMLMVDNQFLPLAKKIEDAMESVVRSKHQSAIEAGSEALRLRYVVNTHYHGDHTGANASFGKSAPIFAHDNVRERLADKEELVKASLPVVTYENLVNIYLGDEKVVLTHLPSGHTDGDTVVFFKEAGVIHTGDLLFVDRFPYVDLKAGGTVKGYLNNLRALQKTISSSTQIIPGHGPLATKQDLDEMIEMFKAFIPFVEKQISEGKTLEQVVANGVLEDYKDWGWRFIGDERWLTTLYTDLSK